MNENILNWWHQHNSKQQAATSTATAAVAATTTVMTVSTATDVAAVATKHQSHFIFMHVHMNMCGFSVDLLVRCLSSNLSRDKRYMQNKRYNQIEQLAKNQPTKYHCTFIACVGGLTLILHFDSSALVFVHLQCEMVIRNYSIKSHCQMGIIICIRFNENARIQTHLHCSHYSILINNLVIFVLSWRQFWCNNKMYIEKVISTLTFQAGKWKSIRNVVRMQCIGYICLSRATL